MSTSFPLYTLWAAELTNEKQPLGNNTKSMVFFTCSVYPKDYETNLCHILCLQKIQHKPEPLPNKTVFKDNLGLGFCKINWMLLMWVEEVQIVEFCWILYWDPWKFLTLSHIIQSTELWKFDPFMLAYEKRLWLFFYEVSSFCIFCSRWQFQNHRDI